jgi:hypothetical protein
MSGPKSGSYEVVSAEELRRRELAAAMGHARAAQAFYGATLASVAADASTYLDEVISTSPPALRTTDDPGAVRRYADQIRAQAVATRGALQHRIGEARRASITAGAVHGLGGEDLRAVDQLLADHPVEEPQVPTPPTRRHREVTAAAVAADLQRIDDDVFGEARSQLEDQARLVLDTDDPARAEMLSDQLRYDIQQANARAAVEVRDVERAVELLADLPQDGETAALADELEGVIRRQRSLRSGVAEEVADVRRRAAATADRAFAAATLQDVLDELGYEVQTGFATVATADGVAYFQHPEWPGYGVRWRLAGDPSAMGFSVVDIDAGDGTSSTRATEVEEAWCQRMPELIGALRTKGVRFSLQRAEGAGALPVPVLVQAPEGLRTAGSRAATRRRDERRQHP